MNKEGRVKALEKKHGKNKNDEIRVAIIFEEEGYALVNRERIPLDEYYASIEGEDVIKVLPPDED